MSCRHLVGIILVVFGFLFAPHPALASNFLQNSDFESSSVDPWTSSGGGAIATISSELIHSGQKTIKLSHDKSSSYGFQQTVQSLEGGMFYEISGYGASKDSNIDTYFLRVAWYESSDASGSQMSSPNDTERGNVSNGEWVQFNQIIQAPANAKSAKVRLVLTSKSNGTLTTAYFDDILFQESVAPSPTVTPTPNPTTAPTNTPQPIQTTAPTATITPSKTPTPTREPTVTPQPTETIEPLVSDILGTQEIATEAGRASESKPLVFSFFFIGTGLGLIATILAWQKTDVWKNMLEKDKKE